MTKVVVTAVEGRGVGGVTVIILMKAQFKITHGKCVGDGSVQDHIGQKLKIKKTIKKQHKEVWQNHAELQLFFILKLHPQV